MRSVTDAAQVGDVFRESTAMRGVVDLVSRAAAVRAGVLIRGEQGTGRRMIARIIHRIESAGPFVAVDCAANSHNGVQQLDAVLFGVSVCESNGGLEQVSRDSLVYQARGGTLFMDNIADAPARVQARLARLFRDREAVVAETREATDIDVRPIASVEPDVDISVKDGRIRDDLFRQLSAIAIDVPALRDRRDDIPALANYFVRQICGELQMPLKALSRPALALIAALPWRGNAAELRALLRSAVTRSAKTTIDIEDVLTHVRLDTGSAGFATRGTLRHARAQFEREYIESVLAQHRGRISDAARALGIQRTNLYRKMRALRVPRRA
jgi:DNA-binding NtrC family response regulator